MPTTMPAIRDELGDLLLQVTFHAQIAADDGRWDIDDVADALVAKLVHRHPHVFGDVDVAGADEVLVNWEKLKAEETGGRKAVDEDIPATLPALARAAKVQRRAAGWGFTWRSRRSTRWRSSVRRSASSRTPRPSLAVPRRSSAMCSSRWSRSRVSSGSTPSRRFGVRRRGSPTGPSAPRARHGARPRSRGAGRGGAALAVSRSQGRRAVRPRPRGGSAVDETWARCTVRRVASGTIGRR